MLGSIISAAGNFATQNNTNEATHTGISNAKKKLGETENYADLMQNQGLQILQQMLDSNQAIYGTNEQAAQQLQSAQNAVNSVDPYQAGEFSYNKSIDDFYDNALGLRMNAANDAINGSQALGGSLFSSDTANKLTAQAQVLGSQAYNDAMKAYTADKGLEQSIWQGNESARQVAANSALAAAQARYGIASDTAGNLADTNNAYYNALLGLNDDYWANKIDYNSQLAQLEAQDPGTRSWFARTFDPAGFFM